MESNSAVTLQYEDLIREILNLEGHLNCITDSRVTVIFLCGWILPIGGASSVQSCRKNLHSTLKINVTTTLGHMHSYIPNCHSYRWV